MKNSQSTVKQSGSSSSQVIPKWPGSSVGSVDYVPGHIKEAGLQQTYLLWLNACYKNGQKNISHPTCSSYDFDTLPNERWYLFPSPESGQDCDYSENNVMWLLWWGHKKLYNVYLILLGHLILKPNHHPVNKAMAHGRGPDSQELGPKNTFPAGFQSTARTNSPVIWMTHLESGSFSPQEATPANEMPSRDVLPF